MKQIIKLCAHCNKVGPHRWRNSKSHPEGGFYRNCCETCHSDKNKTYYSTHREYALDLVNERAIKKKAILVEHLGNKCLDCGLVDDAYVYDFHHRDPAQKDFTISQMRHLSIEELKSEVDKCDLLCAVCHRKRHYKLKQQKTLSRLSDA